MDWKVYFHDGSTHSDGIESLPAHGVAVILQRHPRVGRRILRMAEWYLFDHDAGLWFDQPDAASALARMASGGVYTVRRGHYLAEDRFEEIIQIASRDPDLPPKCGGPSSPVWKEP